MWTGEVFPVLLGLLLHLRVASSSSTCTNTDNGAKDKDGDGCNAYTQPSDGWWDDHDFTANDMCCRAGGGDTCYDTEGSALDTIDLDCTAYDQSYNGLWDDYDFTAEDMCCAAGGGSSVPPPPPPPECYNTNDGALDVDNYDCDAYVMSFNGVYDDNDFTAMDMCCGAGGGAMCSHTNYGATDKDGFGCEAFTMPNNGQWDDWDFTANLMCCASGGGTLHPSLQTPEPTPAPDVPEVCSKSVSGACKQCVQTMDSWCKHNGWDGSCYDLCCGPSEWSDTGCEDDCSSSKLCAEEIDPTPELEPTPEPAPGVCGVKGPDSSPWARRAQASPMARIVNGQDATPCEWKWQVGLVRTSGAYFCGGTLISERWVLTAAHCMEGSFRVALGSFRRNKEDTHEVQIGVSQVIKHHWYNGNTMDYDYALVELEEDAPLGHCIGIACLPSEDVGDGDDCMITGWGTLSSGGGVPNKMKEAMVTTLSNAECDGMLGGGITGRMLCAQGMSSSGITDACQGDSGGPLVCESSPGVWTLYGATSWGYGCADADSPGVWARAFVVRSWVSTVTGIAAAPTPPAPSTPAPTPAPPTPAPTWDDSVDICSDHVDGPCKLCVEEQDEWCSIFVWDDTCHALCCGPTEWAEDGCADVCGSSSWCEDNGDTPTASPTPTPEPTPMQTAADGTDVCSEFLDGPCKQCVESQDDFCEDNRWDDSCFEACCGPTEWAFAGCLHVCGSSRQCPEASPTTAPPAPAPPASTPEPESELPFSCGVKGPDDSIWEDRRLRGVTGRIVNGQAATECEWKWQVALADSSGYYFCGGTLISRRWVLTAAHCMGGSFDIVLGSFEMSKVDSHEVKIGVKQVISHPSYNDWTMDYDIALVELQSSAPIGACIDVACLPEEDIAEGTDCMITGWGTLKSGGSQPNKMQEAMVRILGHDDCNAKLNGEITGRMVCGQGELSGGEVTDACQGDSGGPLVCRNVDGAYTLQGATSWGYGCASPSKPGVWARVFAVRGWIDQQTGGATNVQATPSTSQPISTPAPAPEVCSKQVGGACKRCVHRKNKWCKKNPWDDQCYGLCCEDCNKVCSGSPTCATPSPTPAPPTPLLEITLAKCFMSGGTDAAAQCAEVKSGKFTYYKMGLGESSPNEWTLMFRANFKSLKNNHCAVGFGKVCFAKGAHVRSTACKAGSGWNDWTVLVEGGKGTLYCNGEIIREVGYPSGYSVSPKCGFLVGGGSKNNCNKFITGAKTEVQDMVLHEGNALPPTPAPSMPALSPELESLAAGASARCSVIGMADIAAQCGMGSGNWNFFRLKVGAVTSANWKLVFEADVEQLKGNTPLVSFGNGNNWILKGSSLKQVNNCAAGSGWHLWELVLADGKATLRCDGAEATRYNLLGGYSVPASCSFLIGGRYTKWNNCKKTAAGGKLQVQNVMFIEM